jgi:2-dehydropantoate 2-reductase
MNVAVFGVGSIGGIVASSLISAGKCASVKLVARGRALKSLVQYGLKVHTYEGDDHIFKIDKGQVLNSETLHLQQKSTKQPSLDYLLVCTKAHQLSSIASSLPHLLSPNTIVVPCTNGLPYWFHPLNSTDPNSQLSKIIPRSNLLGSVGMISGAVKPDYSCWETHWPSERNTLLFGEVDGACSTTDNSTSRAQVLADLFHGSEVLVRATACQPSDKQQIRDRIFDKLLINCSINSIGALTGLDCGETCEPGSSSNKMLKRLIKEAICVGEKIEPPLTLSLTPDKISKHYSGQYGLKSSMLHDVENQRKTEKEHIVDALVELGQYYNVNTPCLETVSDLLSTYERRRSMGKDYF